ncbi:MAG TPA: hypothetical protein VEA81_07875 [Burkholderiaceae bacterium]|nr:hypothetical protein [Burkholderiaceae bacterium]
MRLSALFRRRRTWIVPVPVQILPPAPPGRDADVPAGAPWMPGLAAPAAVRGDGSGWDPTRRWRRAPRQRLSMAAHRLVLAVGQSGGRVDELARRYPHVLNAVVLALPDRDAALATLDGFLADRRGGRRGWPDDALAELHALRGLILEPGGAARRR